MRDILNNRMLECYNITSLVINKYNKLYKVMMTYYFEDSSIYEPYVEDVRDLVLKEYNIYSKLTLSDINMCLKSIENIDCDNDKIDSRFKRKLEVLRDTFMGTRVNGIQLGFDFIPDNIDFNLFVALTSLIDISMMKKIKSILDNIKTDNYNDLMFLKELYENFNFTLFCQTFGNNLTEVICLFNNLNIDNIDDINIDKLIRIINNSFGIDNDNILNPVDVTLFELAKISIDRLCSNEFNNNSMDVFENLAFITRLEILISYMNINSLNYLLDYCKQFDNKNEFGMSKVIKLIKSKVGGRNEL